MLAECVCLTVWATRPVDRKQWGASEGEVVGGEGGRGVTMMFVDYTQPQMMRRPAHITMNASLSHYLYIMATTPPRGQASSRLINSLTARPKEKWGARQHCSPLIHRLHLTARPGIAYRTLPLRSGPCSCRVGSSFPHVDVPLLGLAEIQIVLEMRPCCEENGHLCFLDTNFILQLNY